MNSLGSYFPDDIRRQLAITNLRIGSVLRMHVLDTTPPKIKRLIVVGMDPESIMLVTVFINSEINPSIISSTKLQELQYPLESQSLPFLDHNSYADCSKVREREYAAMLEALTQDPSIHLEHLPEDHLRAIRKTISKSKTISLRIKKKYGLFLI